MISRSIAIACLSFLCWFNVTLAEVYYVNAESGMDSNSGTSPEKAWASLEKVNKQVFKPGDKILLAAGSRFIGQLEPKGSGTVSKDNGILSKSAVSVLFADSSSSTGAVAGTDVGGKGHSEVRRAGSAALAP